MREEKRDRLVIGSRESRLAVVQSEMLLDYLRKTHPELKAELLTMKTTGDRILDRRLDEIGGKGLFVKELDLALREGRSDLSVHSLKDLPMETAEDLPLLLFSAREDPRDVLVLPEGRTEPDLTKPIGTSSRRRILQLEKLFPEARFESVRGNLQTRLKKLDEGQYSAIVLAAAGLKRLGLSHRISRYFSVEEIIPAAGQGILAVQGRAGMDYSFLEGFGSPDSAAAALCERAFVRELNGGCTAPIAAHAVLRDGILILDGFYYDEETGNSCRGHREIPFRSEADAERLGRELAQDLLKKTEAAAGSRGSAAGERVSEVSGEERKTGKVWLVGAGPGDPGLFTLRGLEVLSDADVVVYDALVGDGVLGLIPEDAETINVGKRAANHRMPQEEINRTLLREAEKGKKVVRLKGGDPFLFGRGGEELELLTENGIPYEVVPGVTSAVAVPAYNGIPVTHRDFCSSVHIITGHRRKGEEYDIDFSALVQTRGTLVFLMGISSLDSICQGLMAAGMEADMPAAVLEKGTTAGQRRVVATVGTLREEAERKGIQTPAIIVVGRVCALAGQFAWYEKRPLAGKKILLTRPRELSSETAAMLRRKGAEVLELPAIRTVPVTPERELEEYLSDPAQPGICDWIIFTSPTGVRVFMDTYLGTRDIRSLSGISFAVIGKGTEKELLKRGIRPDFIPSLYDGETLGRELFPLLKPGMRILIPRAAAGNEDLIRELSKAEGISISDIPTYNTEYRGSEVIDEADRIRKGEIDYVVFTSASTVRGFAEAVGDVPYGELKAVCIGKQTRAAADALGMRTWMAEKATMEDLVKKVEELAGTVDL